MAHKGFIRSVSSILNGHERANMFVHIILDLLIGILDIAFLGGLLLIINCYTGYNKLNHSLLSDAIYQRNPLWLIAAFCILYALKNWAGYLITRHQNNFFYGIASRLSKRNMLHYLKSNYHSFIEVDSSVYTRKISQQPIEFSSYILTNIQQIVSQSILIFFTFTAILFYHPVTFFSLFLLLLPPVTLLAYFIKGKLKRVRASSKIISQMAIQRLNESLAGYTESNVYNKGDFFTGRYFSQQKQLNENIATMQTLQGLPPRLIEVFAVLGFLILVAINQLTVGANNLKLFDIGVFMAAAYKIIPGVVKILNSSAQIRTYDFVLQDLMADSIMEINKHAVSPVFIRSIKFDGVSFKYKHRQILKELCFCVHRGDFVGISAPSGRGKTTIVNLLLGFLEPVDGFIFINQNSTTAPERIPYRDRISYVKQQPFFINDTILKNITLSDDEYNEDQFIKSVRFCGVDLMLNEYPEGADKMITENGKNISGGQRQRIMLARAVYHDFDVLILDEPFSEVDEDTEHEMLGKLKVLAGEGKMIMMITHNRYSLSICNQVISLNEA